MADLEQLLGAIPLDLHAAWSQRARNLLIDGSPRWDVLRTCAVLPEASTVAAAVCLVSDGGTERCSLPWHRRRWRRRPLLRIHGPPPAADRCGCRGV